MHRPEEDNWEDMEETILPWVPDWKYAAIGAVHRASVVVKARNKVAESEYDVGLILQSSILTF